MSLPTAGTFDVPGTGGSFTNEEFATAQGAFLEAVRAMLGAAVPASISVASGAIAPTVACMEVDTEGGTATDDLNRIDYTSMADGSIILLWPKNASHAVTVKHTYTASYSGRIRLQDATDHVMDDATKCIMLQRRGSVWYEIMRIGTIAQTHGSVLFTANGTWTVPAGVTECWVTMIGGGGGGGGGGGTGTASGRTGNVNGSAGAAGGATSFHTHLTVNGGNGGVQGFASGLGGYANSIGSIAGETSQPTSTTGGQGAHPGATPLGVYGRGGQGGKGADGNGTSYGAGGGGCGGFSSGAYLKENVSGLTPGAVKTITIGAGGAGGAGGIGAFATGSAGQAGANGALLIEW